MKEIERQAAAKKFIKEWSGKGYEKGECQKFWIDLLCNVFGIQDFASFILFEEQVKEYFVENGTKQSKSTTNFIDAYIPSTHVIIEQKSSGKDLREPIKQSNGSLLTPFQQAKNYSANLPYSKRPRWIVTCNFEEFLIYDMERPDGEPQQIFLKDLQKEHYRLQFLVDTQNEHINREEEISLKAGELVGKLYDALYKEYIHPDDNSLRSLNILCVRIVFCLYAEDAGLFETKTAFEDYIQSFNIENLRDGIYKLFKALDTKIENRDKYDTKLNLFPYVNGGLFAYEDIEIPNFSQEIVDVIVNHCAPFDWSEISPTIFGAVFESTLNPETRRKGGMHYTSIENIHKVIDPLFLDDLREEFNTIVGKNTSLRESEATAAIHSISKNQKQRLADFQKKIGSLKFLDPACGSGNFLTETYASLRKIENECIKLRLGKESALDVFGEEFKPQVNIEQFYGIEINDFAVTVAKTALWIAECQMMEETSKILNRNLNFLPLKSHATIVEGNALRMDWEYLHENIPELSLFADKVNIVHPKDIDLSKTMFLAEPGKHYEAITVITENVHLGKKEEKPPQKNHYDFIMGNPPFVGASMMSAEQKEDAVSIFGKKRRANSIDFVGAWYYKATKLIQKTNTKCAFVSTNSITQGEQVVPLWDTLLENYHIHIDFAYRTFHWDSESSLKAHVHCVIIGFSCNKESKRRIFLSNGTIVFAKNITPYLIDAPNILIASRPTPICNVPPITYGNKPADGGNLILSQAERDKLIAKDKCIASCIRRYVGARDFINNDEIRYCLWLKDISPSVYHKNTEIMRRLQAVKEMRLASSAAPTRAFADKPYLFFSTPQTENNYLCIPEVSSERRKYIPIGFMQSTIIAANTVVIVSDATLYHFGILTSNVHMVWMRTVAGRLKSDYRYAGSIVYNNFPWPKLDEKREIKDERKLRIEATAQAILDVRAKYPNASLADLYDDLTMPADLRKAHTENDRAVMEAYGFDFKMTEDEIVAELFKMYGNLQSKKL